MGYRTLKGDTSEAKFDASAAEQAILEHAAQTRQPASDFMTCFLDIEKIIPQAHAGCASLH